MKLSTVTDVIRTMLAAVVAMIGGLAVLFIGAFFVLILVICPIVFIMALFSHQGG